MEIEKHVGTNSRLEKDREILKKTLQYFVVSVSLLSLLLSYSSAISHLFHLFNFHLSAFLFPLLRHTLERKYMFLLCNGILAVLAKTFTITTPSPPPLAFSTDDFPKTTNEETENLVTEIARPPLDDEGEAMETAVKSLQNVAFTGEEKEGGGTSCNKPVLEDTETIPALIMETQDEEIEEAEEEDGTLTPSSSYAEDQDMSTEELNRKFDEFIRKMKEELRIAAQQQLIAV